MPLTKSVASQACTFSTSPTPFLYQTKTLEGHSWDAKCQNPLRRPHKGHRSFHSTSRNSAQANDTPLHDPIPSENTSKILLSVPAKYRIRVPGQNRLKVDPPIFPSDGQISRQMRLIDQICSELSHLSDSRYSKDDHGDERSGRRLDAYEEIVKLFERAIREVELQEERTVKRLRMIRSQYWTNTHSLRAIDVSQELGQMTRRALPAREPWPGMIDPSRNLAKFPHRALRPRESLQELAGGSSLQEIADGSRNEDTSVLIEDTSVLVEDTSVPVEDTFRLAVDEFDLERRYHEERFMRELERAQTDDAVWSVLETKVFSLIRAVEKRNEDKASQQDDKTKSKLATPKKVRHRKGQPKQKQIGPVVLEAEAEVSFQSPPPTSSLAPVTQPSPASISPDAISSIINHNYGRYCLKALQVLRKEFPASLYTLMILPTIKTLGSISYVLGATSGLYNELLHLKWTEYADLHGMADILEEMRNQGVQQDRVTAAVIRMVEREREAQLKHNEDDEDVENDWIIDEHEDADVDADEDEDKDTDEDETGEEQRQHQRHPTAARPKTNISNNNNNTATATWWKLRHVQEGWIRLMENFYAAEQMSEQQRLRSAQDERDLRALEEAEAEVDAKVSWPKEKVVDGDGGTPSLFRRVLARRTEEIKMGLE